jgi:hypothetical protein
MSAQPSKKSSREPTAAANDLLDSFKQPNQFAGKRTDFPKFVRVIYANLATKLAEDEVNFYKNWNDYAYNAEGKPTNLPNRFKTIDQLDSLDLPGAQVGTGRNARAPTIEEKKDRRAAIQAIQDHNDRIVNMNKIASTVMCERVSTAIGEHFIRSNNALIFWRYLQQTYSPALATFGKGPEMRRLVAARMENHEWFSAFISEYDRRCDSIGFPRDLRIGFLLADGTDECKFHMLPTRLEEMRKIC